MGHSLTAERGNMPVEQAIWMVVNSFLGVGGISGATYTLWSVYKSRRESKAGFAKTMADIRSIETDTDIKLDKARLEAIVDLTKQLDQMRTTIVRLEQENLGQAKKLSFCEEQLELLRNYNTMLKGILRGHNIPIPE